MDCIPDGILRAYVDRQLDPAELASVETHLAACSTCQARATELSAAALRIHGQLDCLEGTPPAASEQNPQMSLARFKANLPPEPIPASFIARLFSSRWRFAWAASLTAAILVISLAFPSTRGFAQKLLATLRIEKVQTIAFDMASFDNPPNRAFQDAIGKMVSDNVVVTTDEKALDASTVQDASALAGFQVRIPALRSDAPQVHVGGAHAFHMTVDRSRLQDILDTAGRTDLILPATLDGADLSVQIPRNVELTYGNCYHPKSGLQLQEAPATTSPVDCVFLIQAPSPVVNVPSDLNIQQLAETALQLAGMNAQQARQFGQSIDWRSTLVLPIPSSVHSYEAVTVDGVQGTLMNTTSRLTNGPSYVIVWVKSGIIYALGGAGGSSAGLQLANSLD